MPVKMNHKETYQLLAFVRQYILDHGYPPSYGDIQRVFPTMSKSTIERRLQRLEKVGYLKITHNIDRGIALTEFGRTLLPWKE